MKVHELIAELGALSSVGLRDAEVELVLFGSHGGQYRRLVVGTERSNDQVPRVVLRSLTHRQAEEAEE
jgi:hypothetical protein